MFKIPTIQTHDELLEMAFHRAAKIAEKTKIKNKLKRHKIQVLSKLDVVADTIDSKLNKFVKAFPSFNQLHKFDFELIDLTIGIDRLRKSLGAIDWARQQVQDLRGELRKKINRISSFQDYPKLESYRQMFYGRTASILSQVGDNLKFLNTARNDLKKLPTIDPETYTIVVAGYPNVGKSLLVKQISSARPVVATYPFTTQQLNIGHIIIDYTKIQIIDTPGLLDRSFEKRNKIERQAIMALRYLANLIIFMLDPSEHCGYTIDEQKGLLKEIHKLFHDVEIIEIENKVDLYKSDNDLIKISAITGQGLDELMVIITGRV